MKTGIDNEEYFKRMVHHIKEERDGYKKALTVIQEQVIKDKGNNSYNLGEVTVRLHKVMFQRDLILTFGAGLLFYAIYITCKSF